MPATSALLILTHPHDLPVTPDTIVRYRSVAVAGRRYLVTPGKPHPTATPVTE
jgi:hypothetical protein